MKKEKEKRIEACGITVEQAIEAVAKQYSGPCGIDVFDHNAITSTSDGILAEDAMIAIAASDRGIVSKHYGMYPMLESPYSEELIKEDPNLAPWKKLFPDKRLFRGCDPKYRVDSVHNCVITGRACNNNAASEVMNLVSMKEMLFPHFGITSLLNGKDVMVGLAGEVISVGIGMSVAEEFGRIVSKLVNPCPAGDTLHKSGKYAKTLKRDLPAVVCRKRLIAQHVINELNAGMVVAYNIACSPLILTIARMLDKPICWERITDESWAELESIGFTREYIEGIKGGMSEEEILDRADELLPGMEDAVLVKAADIVRECSVEV